MEPDFWKARWREGRIGFHQTEINVRLQTHRGAIRGGKLGRVLVPLAGKSRDMTWLAQRGDPVVGVEVVEQAVQSFFEEAGIEPKKTTTKIGTHWETPGLEMWCADFFAVDKKTLGHVDWVYDRAALIALPPTLRPRYVAHLLELLEPEAEILLVSLEYEEGKGVDGPPFNVTAAEVERLFGPLCRVERLESAIAPEHPRFLAANLSGVEVVWRIVRR